MKVKCPVCKQDVEIKDKLIAEHQHKNKQCYGSFMPEYEGMPTSKYMISDMGYKYSKLSIPIPKEALEKITKSYGEYKKRYRKI